MSIIPSIFPRLRNPNLTNLTNWSPERKNIFKKIAFSTALLGTLCFGINHLTKILSSQESDYNSLVLSMCFAIDLALYYFLSRNSASIMPNILAPNNIQETFYVDPFDAFGDAIKFICSPNQTINGQKISQLQLEAFCQKLHIDTNAFSNLRTLANAHYSTEEEQLAFRKQQFFEMIRNGNIFENFSQQDLEDLFVTALSQIER